MTFAALTSASPPTHSLRGSAPIDRTGSPAPSAELALRGSSQISQQGIDAPITTAQRKAFAQAAYDAVVNRPGFNKRGALQGYAITVQVAGANLESTANFQTNTKAKTATILVNPSAIDDFVRLDRERPNPSLGKAGLESVMVNELFGIAHSANHPNSSPGKDSQILELASNRASRRYLDKFYPDLPERYQLLGLLAQNDELIRLGREPYVGRSRGTPAEKAEAAETLKLMGL